MFGIGGRWLIASRTLLSLPKLTWSGRIVPASFSWPRCSASSCALPSSTAMSASLACVSWYAAIAACRTPRGLSRSRASPPGSRGPRRPRRRRSRTGLPTGRPAGPTSPAPQAVCASAGSRTSSNASSEVIEARSESLCDIVACREARGVGRHDEPAIPSSVLRPHDRDVGDGPVGDPHLRAVENPVAAVAARVGAHPGGIGPEVRLR